MFPKLYMQLGHKHKKEYKAWLPKDQRELGFNNINFTYNGPVRDDGGIIWDLTKVSDR